MYLNEFLTVKLGVNFENKYNALAVKEIMENKEKYPLIAESIENEIECAKINNKTWNYSSGFFDCDDDSCANYDETMQLYRAFVIAFGKNIINKKFKVNYAAFGIDYLEQPNTHNVLDPFYHYLGANYIGINTGKTYICENVYYSNVIDGEKFGQKLIERHQKEYFTNNTNVLDDITDNLKNGHLKDYFYNSFDNDVMFNNFVILKSGETAYPCYSYEIRIGKNILKFFTTECGFDPLGDIRLPISESLTDEQKALEVVQSIISTIK